MILLCFLLFERYQNHFFLTLHQPSQWGKFNILTCFIKKKKSVNISNVLLLLVHMFIIPKDVIKGNVTQVSLLHAVFDAYQTKKNK